MPLFRDIAEDVYETCDDLIRRLDETIQYELKEVPGSVVPAQSFDSTSGAPTIPSFGGVPTMPGAAESPGTPVTLMQSVQPSQPAKPSQPSEPSEPLGGSFDGPGTSEPTFSWGEQDNSGDNPLGGPF